MKRAPVMTIGWGLSLVKRTSAELLPVTEIMELYKPEGTGTCD
jgi:hypothetical protein